MEPLHETFLQILNAALHGQPAEPIPQEQLPRLYALAQTHKVLPLIYEAHPDPQIRRTVMQQVMTQTVKTSDFLALYRHLLDAGLRPLVVKGIVGRSLYPKPDLRQSSDEDLLVLPHQLQACHEAMLSFGLETDGNLQQYELPYRAPSGPLFIELHQSLFPPQSDAYGGMNQLFENAHRDAVQTVISGVPVYTLCPTDHLQYLICHAFKHFLHSGFGIRQVCDIVLYADRYADQIDWARLINNCRSIRAEQFAAALFQIGEKHLGFPMPAAFSQYQIDELPLLSDLVDSGIYGSATEDRLHSSSITLNAASGSRKSNLLASLFPSAKTLETRYPYLRKYPWLLPAAWCARIFHYSSRNTSAAASMQIGSRRVELLKYYGIIEKT